MDLPNFGTAESPASGWRGSLPTRSWATSGITTRSGSVAVHGDGQGVLSPPQGWNFSNTAFTFEDNQFFVARVTDGQQQRMARCSPALQECVLLDPPNDPENRDGEPLELGSIVLGGIEPVTVGKQFSSDIRQGYLVADPDPPCGGNHWLWSGQLSEGLYFSASQDGIITALGTDKEGLETDDGIGVGSSLRALKATYGEFLAPLRPTTKARAAFREGRRRLARLLPRPRPARDRCEPRAVHRGRQG